MRLGLTATPIYNITKDTNVSDLEDTMHSDDRMMQDFFLRPTGFNNAEGLSKLRWQDISRCYSSSNEFVCSTRRNGATYWSPTWAEFSASIGWYEDDDWGANWEVGGGFGYEDIRDERLQNGGGGEASGPSPTPTDSSNQTSSTAISRSGVALARSSTSPSGLFALVAGMWSDQGDSNTIHAGVFTGTSAPQMNSWEVQLGIQRKMGPLGAFGDTSFWGGFAEVNNGIGAGSNGNGGNLGGIPADRFLKAGTFADVTLPTEITGADVNRRFPWSRPGVRRIRPASLRGLPALQRRCQPGRFEPEACRCAAGRFPALL